MKNGRCKGCGQEVFWIRTSGSKTMPCDPDPVAYWEKAKAKGKVVLANGQVVSCVFDGDFNKATGIGYISHFATCPKASSFRRK